MALYVVQETTTLILSAMLNRLNYPVMGKNKYEKKKPQTQKVEDLKIQLCRWRKNASD
jgi:hypothetical protein